MTTFCKLKDGREMVVWSEDVKNEKLHVYPIIYFDENPTGKLGHMITVDHSEVAVTDQNRVIAFGTNIGA